MSVVRGIGRSQVEATQVPAAVVRSCASECLRVELRADGLRLILSSETARTLSRCPKSESAWSRYF